MNPHENHYEPIPPESQYWDEFQWELLWRKCDRFSHRYLKLSQRFADLPASNDLIFAHLGELKLPVADEPEYSFEDMSQEMEVEEATHPDQPAGTQPPPPFFHENFPPYRLLLQVSLGWCNTYASFLRPQHRAEGSEALYYLGRSLVYFAHALGDGHYDPPQSFIAACKRALDHLNKAIGIIEQLAGEELLYAKITDAMKGHLREIHDSMVDHMGHLRTLSTAK